VANKKMTRDAFLNKANLIHNNKYNYTETEFNTLRDYIKIICPEHGEFTQRANAHLDKQGCRKCRNSSVGDRFRSNKEEFIKEANILHDNKYNYDKFVYITDKISGIIYCPTHDLEFEQTPNNHKRTKEGCPKCSRELHAKLKRNSLEKTIELCESVHGVGVFDYSQIPNNVHSHDRVHITCNTCGGTFEQLMYSHSNIGNGCPICKVSKDEIQLGKFITNELGLDIIRSDRKTLEGKEIDILIPSHNIGIEINGNYWHSDLIAKHDRLYHLNKTEKARTEGIQLIQFFGDEMYNKNNICLSIVRNKLGLAERIYARKCTVKEVSVDDKNIFLNTNHIQGADASKIKLGLYLNNELVSVMTFGTPRYNKMVEWELIRFCTKLNTCVIGGASKLYKHFIKTHTPKSIISYADKRISDGNVYDILGFSHTHDALPRYYYMHRKNYLKRLHRSNFTKDRIKKLYPEVDIQSNDEWTLMQTLGYDRIWDCGNKVYVWTVKN
jgi:hypothetical protein